MIETQAQIAIAISFINSIITIVLNALLIGLVISAIRYLRILIEKNKR